MVEEAFKEDNLIADMSYKPQGCGWEDVLNCIDAVKESYQQKGKNSKIREWARSADTTTEITKSLASMIPDEKGLSVMREGLVFLLQVIIMNPNPRGILNLAEFADFEGMATKNEE